MMGREIGVSWDYSWENEGAPSDCFFFLTNWNEGEGKVREREKAKREREISETVKESKRVREELIKKILICRMEND